MTPQLIRHNIISGMIVTAASTQMLLATCIPKHIEPDFGEKKHYMEL